MGIFSKKSIFITFFTLVISLSHQSFAYDPYTQFGTTTSTTNPRVLNDSTTGLYTSGPGKIDFSVSGTRSGEFSSTGLSIPNKIVIGTSTFGSSLVTINGSTTTTTKLTNNQ